MAIVECTCGLKAKTTIAEAMINDACPMVIRIVFAIPCHNTASVAEPKPA